MNRTRSAALACLLIVSALCATGCALTDKTTLDASWTAPDRPAGKFGKVMVITVSTNEFAQKEFQDKMAAHLREHGVDAVASHYYFTRYTKEERQRFEKAIADSGADSFLLARVTTTERRSRDVPDVILGPGNVPSNSSLDIYGAFLVYGGVGGVMPQADFTPTTMSTEASLYAGKDRKLVWTARTKTKNAGSGERAVAIRTQAGMVQRLCALDRVWKRRFEWAGRPSLRGLAQLCEMVNDVAEHRLGAAQRAEVRCALLRPIQALEQIVAPFPRSSAAGDRVQYSFDDLVAVLFDRCLIPNVGHVIIRRR